MSNLVKKLANRDLRKLRIRASVQGTAQRPRLSVFVSNQHVSAQIINDQAQQTLASSISSTSEIKGNKTEKAAWVGTDIAKKAKKAKISQVVFDRNGRHYQGRLKALADAARQEGLEF